MRSGSLTSPAFIDSTSLRRSGERSFRLSGPIRPALAFDGELRDLGGQLLEALAARDRARRISSAFALAASSAATFSTLGSPGTATRISRSVTVGGVVNSLRCDS